MPKSPNITRLGRMEVINSPSALNLATAREEIKTWSKTNSNYGRNALEDIINGSEGILARDRNGKLIGIASLSTRADGNLELDWLSTSGTRKGTGTRIVREATRIASQRGVGIELTSAVGAIGFYQKLGMSRIPSPPYLDKFGFTAEQAARFARGRR